MTNGDGPMGDIVGRLRKASIWAEPLFNEAAAEIERLRTALEDVRKSKMPGESRAIAIRALTAGGPPSALQEKVT